MIIDFHTHSFPDKIAEATVEALKNSSGYNNAINGKTSDLIAEMNSSGVGLSVNLPILTHLGSFEKLLKNFEAKNEEEKRIINFAPIHPMLPDLKQAVKAVANLGFKGIKIHPYFQSFSIDCIESERLIGYASEFGLITVVHAGFDASYPGDRSSAPERLLKLFDDVKPQNVVLAHMGAQDCWQEVLDEMCGLDCYFDTSFSMDMMPKDMFRSIVAKRGASKILFGTDSPWKKQTDYIKLFDEMNFSEIESRQILGENAKKLLNL